MRVLLASLSIETESRMQDDPNAAYSLGLGYIQAVLEQKGHDVRLQFLNNFDQEHSAQTFFKMVAEWQPQVVGLQVFSMNRTASFEAIERLRRKYADVVVVIPENLSTSVFDTSSTVTTTAQLELVGDVTKMEYIIGAVWTEELINQFILGTAGIK